MRGGGHLQQLWISPHLPEVQECPWSGWTTSSVTWWDFGVVLCRIWWSFGSLPTQFHDIIPLYYSMIIIGPISPGRMSCAGKQRLNFNFFTTKPPNHPTKPLPCLWILSWPWNTGRKSDGGRLVKVLWEGGAAAPHKYPPCNHCWKSNPNSLQKTFLQPR